MRAPFLATLAAALLSAAVPALAQDSIRPCNERQVGHRTVDGSVLYVFRIRPRAGTACRLNMNIGSNVMIRQLRVIERPRHGRLVSARRNRIVYRAGRSPREDLFGLAFRVQNRAGTGWVNVAVQVRPRR